MGRARSTNLSAAEYEEYVKPLEDTGFFSDAEIAEILSGYTQRAIAISTTRDYLRAKNLWSQRQGNVFVGKFQDAFTDPGTPAEIVTALDEFWSIIFGVSGPDSGTVLWTDSDGDIVENQPAGQQLIMWTWLRDNRGDIKGSDFGQYYKQGGGRIWPQGVTEQNVIDSRNLWEQEQNDNAEQQALAQRQTNAAGLAIERQTTAMDEPTLEATWTQAWRDAT